VLPCGTLPLTGRISRAGSARDVRIAGNSMIHSDGKGKGLPPLVPAREGNARPFGLFTGIFPIWMARDAA
jgi:hypothetical protein